VRKCLVPIQDYDPNVPPPSCFFLDQKSFSFLLPLNQCLLFPQHFQSRLPSVPTHCPPPSLFRDAPLSFQGITIFLFLFPRRQREPPQAREIFFPFPYLNPFSFRTFRVYGPPLTPCCRRGVGGCGGVVVWVVNNRFIPPPPPPHKNLRNFPPS